MRVISKLLLIILMPTSIVAQTNSTVQLRPLVVTHATVIDMTGSAPMPEMTVVVQGNRIAEIGKSGEVQIPDDAQVVDGSGKFLIPGLWDMHVHLFNNVSAPGTNNKETYFPLFIANGVTGVRDMFTDADDLEIVREWRSEMEAGGLIAPRIAPGSSIIDGVPVYQRNSVGVTNAEEARQAVRTFKAAGAGFIKVYNRLTRESFFAIADEAKEQNIPFAGHVPESVTAVEASNAGQKSIEHLSGMFMACSADEEMRSFSEEMCREVADVFARNNTWNAPTNVVNRSLYLSDEEGFQNDTRLRYVSAGEAQDWKNLTDTRLRPATREYRESQFQRFLEISKILHEAGVGLLAGSDVGNPYVYAGFSLHDELELYTQAGFTPYEALETATVNPSRYLGMEESVGTIEEGKFADLVLLDANPLADILNTRKISAVIMNGRLFDSATMDKMLADAAAAANKN
jgi:imidazolonepropionase-like amidohydrolase